MIFSRPPLAPHEDGARKDPRAPRHPVVMLRRRETREVRRGDGRSAPVMFTLPRWVGPAYIGLAACLVPWIVWLAVSLPTRTRAHHWNLAWVGLDVAEAAMLIATGWSAVRGSSWIEISATATATLLVLDAWFDCTTASPGWAFVISLVLALVVELPLAGLSLLIARRSLARRREP
jgi:hypothetical protein